MKLISIDLFSGVGGLTEGMHQAGFNTKLAIELDEVASTAYKKNHKKTVVITRDISKVTIAEVKRQLKGKPLHLLAGCPPCQGFSTIRTLNRKKTVADKRNQLINQFVRFVRGLRPYTVMMENVPGLIHYTLFKRALKSLKDLGYNVDYKIVNVREYGVPQNRKRLVLVGSRIGDLKVAEAPNIKVTVRDAIGKLPNPKKSTDRLHKVFPSHIPEVLERIKLTPRNGGSRTDLPKKYLLNCHKGENRGFNDIYGRLRWDDYSTTITGGCLNPSKGRFLHPTQHRNISAREAALLQSFPCKYKFPADLEKGRLALLIGNALPPKFSYFQSNNIKKHLQKYFG